MAGWGGIKVDTSQFESALKDMMGQSKRKLEAVLRENAKGFVRKIIALTPPSRSTRASLGKAKKEGMNKVAADIHRVLQGVPKKAATIKTEIGMKQAHRAHRYQGQVSKDPVKKITVPKTMMNAYIRKQKQKVGRLAAGWKSAASALGVRLPTWITRHSTQSTNILTITDTEFSFKISNHSPYANKIRRLGTRIQRALDVQANAMRSRTAHYAKLALKRAMDKANRG